MAAEESPLGRPFMHSFSNHSQQVIEQLNVQRYYGTFTDVVIRVNDVDFKLHKCLLAACSAKFQAMLFSLRQECSNVIDLKEISATGFRYIVEYLYTGVLKMDPLCAQDVLVAAQFLELRDVEKVVLEFFKNIGSDAPMPPTEAALSLMRMSQGVGLTSVSNNEYQEVAPHEVQEAPAPQVAPPVVDVQVPSEQQTQQQQQLIEQQQQQQQVAQQVASLPEATPRTSLPSLPQTWPVHLPTSHAQSAAVAGMYPTGAPYDGSCFEEYLKIIESFQGQSELIGGQATALSRQQLFGQMQRPIGMMAATMKPGLDPSSYIPAMATTTVTTTLPPVLHPTPQSQTDSASVPQTALATPAVNLPETVTQATAAISAAPQDKPLTETPFLRQTQHGDEEEEEEEDEEDDFDEDGVSITEEEPEEDAIPKVETVLLKLKKQEASSYKVIKITGEGPRVQDAAPAAVADAMADVTVDDEANNVIADVKEETSRESSPNEDIASNSSMAKEIAIQTSSASYIRKMKKRFKKFSSKKRTMRKSTLSGGVLQVSGKRKRGRPRKKTMMEQQDFLSNAQQLEDGSNHDNNIECEDELTNDEGNDDDYVPEADLEPDLMEIKSKPLKKRLKDEKLISKRSSRKKKVKRIHDCSHCGRQFGKHEALRRHMQMHESIVMYSCHICAQKYVRPTELTQHMRSHTAEKYTCPDCNLEYKDPRLYKKHMISKHRESKPFHCNFDGCGFSSNRPSNVEKHAVIHSGVKTYSCSNCGKCFAQPNGLQSHLKSCYQKRGYLCDFCGQKFNYLQSMKSHRLLHTGEKPHICPDCGARFADQRNFKRHRRIHENTYPYSCSCCDKKFRHSNSLKAHLNIHRKHQAQELQALHVMNFASVNSSNSQPGTQEVVVPKSYPQAQNHQPVYPQLVNNPEANTTLPTPTPPPQPSLQPPVTPASQSHVQPSTTPHPVQSPIPTSISLPLSMSITMTSPPPQTAPLATPLPAPFPMTLQGHLQALPPGMQGNLQVHHVHGSIPMSAMTVAPAHMLPLPAGAYESAGIKYLEKPSDGQMHGTVQPQVHSALSLSHPGTENTGT